MSFNFHGFLAGLSVLRGRTENPEVLACLHRCKEGLEVPPADLLEPGMVSLVLYILKLILVLLLNCFNIFDLVLKINS